MLPSLTAIDALDHVARLGSMAAAAEALSLTPGAVSQKIKALEIRLGFALTSPQGRGVALTVAAERYLDATRPALQAIRQAGSAPGARAHLTVASPPGFASHWLAPRLAGFLKSNPHLTLELARDGASADIAISFREAPQPYEALFATPQFFPVIAPHAAYEAGAPTAIKGLASARLLHLFNKQDWADWASAAGRPEISEAPGGMVFQDANMLFSAATAGLGVALGDEITCSAALRSGALVRLFSRTAPSSRSYYVKAAETEAAAAFVDWLKAELA